MSSGLVTFHRQKDGRYNLGTAIHSDEKCPALKGRIPHRLVGEIAKLMQRCKKCRSRVIIPLPASQRRRYGAAAVMVRR